MVSASSFIYRAYMIVSWRLPQSSITVSLLRIRNHYQFLIEEIPGIEFRRLLTLSHLSRALHQPRVSLPPGYTPDLHQMKPMSLLERGWFHDLLQIDTEGNNDTKSPKYLAMDWWLLMKVGWGKTLSCVISALNVLDDSNKTVLILCPPLLKTHWLKLFEHTQHEVHFWNGTKLVKRTDSKGCHSAQ